MSTFNRLRQWISKGNYSMLALGLMVVMAGLFATACGDSGPKTYNFTLENKTGYDIKKLYLAPASSEEWVEDEEILKGKVFANGASLPLTFNTPKKATQWDMKVAWADGSPDSKWNKIKLDGATKLTMSYNKETDTTSINGQAD